MEGYDLALLNICPNLPVDGDPNLFHLSCSDPYTRARRLVRLEILHGGTLAGSAVPCYMI